MAQPAGHVMMWRTYEFTEPDSIIDFRSQFYQTLISLFFRFLLLSLAILKYRQYFIMLQTLKLNNEKWKKSTVYEEKSLVGLTRGPITRNRKKTSSLLYFHIKMNIELSWIYKLPFYRSTER